MTDQTICRAVIAGTGSALPRRCVTNAELAETHGHVRRMDRRTHRDPRALYIAASDETTATLGAEAARRALAAAGDGGGGRRPDRARDRDARPDLSGERDESSGTCSASTDCVAFDVQAVCSGFLYALTVAESMMRTGGVAHTRW